MTKPPDAPWKFIWKPVTLDGKEYTVYYLGGDGKKALENAMCRQQFNEARFFLERDIKELKSMLNVLTDLIGGPSAMVEYFKDHMLVQLSKKACRPSELIFKPYTVFKSEALAELVKEGKVHRNRGWVKL